MDKMQLEVLSIFKEFLGQNKETTKEINTLSLAINQLVTSMTEQQKNTSDLQKSLIEIKNKFDELSKTVAKNEHIERHMREIIGAIEKGDSVKLKELELKTQKEIAQTQTQTQIKQTKFTQITLIVTTILTIAGGIVAAYLGIKE